MCLCREKFRQLHGIFKQQTKVYGEFIPQADRTLQFRQTGKLGSFRRDLGGTTAVKSKGRAKSLTQGLQGAQKQMLQCTCQMNIDI